MPSVLEALSVRLAGNAVLIFPCQYTSDRLAAKGVSPISPCCQVTHEQALGPLHIWSFKPRSDHNLRSQGPVDRALIRNLQQPRPLININVSDELYITLDLIDHANVRFAILAVGRMYPRVPNANANSLQRPLLAPGVESNGH